MKKRKTGTKFTLSLTGNEPLLGWLYLALELLVLPSILYSLAPPLGITSEAVLNFLYYLANFLFCVRIFRNLLADSLLRAGDKPGELVITVLAGFALAELASLGLGKLITLLSPEFANANDAAVLAMIADAPVLMFLGTVFLAPVAEECLFRGLMFTPLRNKNRLAAYLLSALAFCCVHVMGYVGAVPTGTLVLCFVQYLPAGLILAWAYERSNSLFSPILIHCAINLVSYLTLR